MSLQKINILTLLGVAHRPYGSAIRLHVEPSYGLSRVEPHFGWPIHPGGVSYLQKDELQGHQWLMLTSMCYKKLPIQSTCLLDDQTLIRIL